MQSKRFRKIQDSFLNVVTACFRLRRPSGTGNL